MFSHAGLQASRFIPVALALLLLTASVATTGRAQVGPTPSFSHAAGFYGSEFDLVIESIVEDAVVRYTLDGSEPTVSSPSFEVPLRITDRSGDENDLSMIQTSWNWQAPSGRVPKASVIRAATFLADSLLGDVVTRTYFVGDGPHRDAGLPVISIVTERDNFFDYDDGIYVPGRVFDDEFDASRQWWQHPGNYSMRGREWERPIHIEIFETEGDFSAALNAGARIHGGATRTYRGKALRLYFRSDYDEQNRLEHPIFLDQERDNFKRLLLRMSGNDASYSLFRDVLIQRLSARMGIETQDARSTIVYINGEYWGIHHARERYDHRYIENVYGIDRDEIDMLELDASPEYGTADHYLSMLEFIRTSDMSTDDAADELETMMDIEDFIAYQVSQIFFDNTDWPHNNIRYWRKQTDGYQPDAPAGHDGRWRWLLYDTDFGFGLHGRSPSANTLSHAQQSGWATELLQAVLSNESLRNRFLNTFADHLNTTFASDLTISVLDSLQQHLEPSMPDHIARWRWPSSMSGWENELGRMRFWAVQRPGHVWNHLRSGFDVGTSSFSVSVEGGGGVHVNSRHFESPAIAGTGGGGGTVLTGQYFAGIPVRMIAEAAPGYAFERWTGTEHSGDTIYVDPGSTSHVSARFVREGEPIPTAHRLDQSDWTLPAWAPAEAAGTYPENMIFLQSREKDPTFDAFMQDPYLLEYDLDARSRVVGLGDGGFAFINTGANDHWEDGAEGRDLGDAVLAIDTRNVRSVAVEWTGTTIRANERTYAIRLQYRVGDLAPFSDVLDSEGAPLEYTRADIDGHAMHFSATLPVEAEDEAYVQLRWRYHHVDGDSGPRAMLGVSGIRVSGASGGTSSLEVPPQLPTGLMQNIPNPFTRSTEIPFALATDGHVRVAVFDVLGRLVATPVDGWLPSGEHNVVLEAQDLASGTYIYRIESSDHSESRTMTLVR